MRRTDRERAGRSFGPARSSLPPAANGDSNGERVGAQPSTAARPHARRVGPARARSPSYRRFSPPSFIVRVSNPPYQFKHAGNPGAESCAELLSPSTARRGDARTRGGFGHEGSWCQTGRAGGECGLHVVRARHPARRGEACAEDVPDLLRTHDERAQPRESSARQSAGRERTLRILSAVAAEKGLERGLRPRVEAWSQPFRLRACAGGACDPPRRVFKGGLEPRKVHVLSVVGAVESVLAASDFPHGCKNYGLPDEPWAVPACHVGHFYYIRSFLRPGRVSRALRIARFRPLPFRVG